MASGVVFVHEDAGRAREIVGPAIAYQRTRYAEWGTDKDKPPPEPISEEDLPWERYLVGTPEEVAEALIELYQEAPYDHLCFWGRLPVSPTNRRSPTCACSPPKSPRASAARSGLRAIPGVLGEDQAAFLVRQRVARLATSDGMGKPHAVPVASP